MRPTTKAMFAALLTTALLVIGSGVSAAFAATTVSEAYGSGGTLLNLTFQNGKPAAPASFFFNAREATGNPLNATGYVRAAPRNIAALAANGPVKCLEVHNNTFGLVYQLDSTSGSTQQVGSYLYVTGIDHGFAGFDYTGIVPQGSTAPTSCAPKPWLNFLGPVTDGDFVVRQTTS